MHATNHANAADLTHFRFQEARGTGSPTKGGGQFYVSHRKELLDVPGEFWHDVETNTMYLVIAGNDTADGAGVGVGAGADASSSSPPSPLQSVAAPAGPAYLVVPQVSQLFAAVGTQDTPVAGVRITSVTLQHVAPTYMHPYTVPSGGDYSVHRGGAVHLNGTVNCSFDHNLLDRIGGNVRKHEGISICQQDIVLQVSV